MMPAQPYFDTFLQFINSTWGTAVLGWILGGLSAWLAHRRHARMQAETIKTLSDALVAFESRFAGHLEPLTDEEHAKLDAARAAFLTADAEPSVVRLYAWSFLKLVIVPFLLTALFALLAAGVNRWFGVGYVLFLTLTLLGLPASFFYVSEERSFAFSRRLAVVQQRLLQLDLKPNQFEHLRRWAGAHAFAVLARSAVLRTIEGAFLANSRRPAAA